jgi:hypothetical protein
MNPRKKAPFPEIPTLTELEAENIITRNTGNDDGIPILTGEEAEHRATRKKKTAGE